MVETTGGTRRTIIFDYDDTLAPNQKYHDTANSQLLDYLGKSFNEAPKMIESRFNEIDIGNIPKYGLGPKRAGRSWCQTYDELCSIYGTRKNPYAREKIRLIAKSGFQANPGFADGAKEVLNYLKSRGDKLALVTRGNERLQRKKLKMNGMERWFAEEDTYIVPVNKTEAFKKILETAPDPYNVISIGDSYTSDILPAAKLGIAAVHIPIKNPWVYDGVKRDKTKEDGLKIFQLNSLQEFPKLYEEKLV